MTRRALCAIAAVLLGAAPALAATPKRAAVPAPARASAPAPAAAPGPSPAQRRLGDVHIEGELEVPRVTFITARRPPRFRDFARGPSVRSSRRLADETKVPSWISPVPVPAQDVRKENSK
jgi:hypothetical protein